MKKTILFILIAFATHVNAQKINKKVQDPSRNKEIMINQCNRAGLEGFPEFKERYADEYSAYTADSATLIKLKPLLKDKKITIVLGTWCGDSKLQLPHFFKMADILSIPEKDITLICVDGNKKSENGLTDALNIERVPTFIIYQSGKELGRITESPQESLEKDLFKILSGKL